MLILCSTHILHRKNKKKSVAKIWFLELLKIQERIKCVKIMYFCAENKISNEILSNRISHRGHHTWGDDASYCWGQFSYAFKLIQKVCPRKHRRRKFLFTQFNLVLFYTSHKFSIIIGIFVGDSKAQVFRAPFKHSLEFLWSVQISMTP